MHIVVGEKQVSNIWGDMALRNRLARCFARFSERCPMMLFSLTFRLAENSGLQRFDTKLCSAFVRVTKGQIAFCCRIYYCQRTGPL
ncbi:hypothetical protein TH24_03945 [Thalassospira xiamenensis]|uniref:Uncharacterized protein n=1 Tax=Thalassospira permensis NBRC 106175 TaxID=1353532 RepID=A0ABR4TVC4_9PROT|nr:hypothetical protein SMB34_01930 [Thalassospira permensis NBRC 106175]RCK42437.1 hypothetical protein TH24_03945 [Thalassospira xiamenensis]